MSHLSPREIVAELDRFIVGQNDAKRAVAVALRNRWRRQQLSPLLRDEVLPKNILLIGPTGVGKTEIARRLAKLAEAPFLKVEATKFTEVGYVGRDVEQIVRDLIEVSVRQMRAKARAAMTEKAGEAAEEKLIGALVGESATPETRMKFRHMLRAGELDAREVEVEVQDKEGSTLPTFDVPGMPGAQMGMINLGDIFGKALNKTKMRKLPVSEARKVLEEEAAEALVDQEKLVEEAILNVEQNGIVFIDEIDKIAARSEFRGGGDVSREGVQRDLLPLIEGTAVSTKYGTVHTDHILFIASGAFHIAKPSDLLPELQGRLPIRVELQPLSEKDFRRILVEPEASLIKQYKALLATEKVTLTFSDDAIDEIARLAAEINRNIENIGARRLHTILEKLLEDISFEASDKPETTQAIDADYVKMRLADFAADTDLSKFIL